MPRAGELGTYCNPKRRTNAASRRLNSRLPPGKVPVAVHSQSGDLVRNAVRARVAEVGQAPPSGSGSAEELLTQPLRQHPEVKEGVLDNGLHWVVLPNKMPPGRFEAHLQMHAGSIDEQEHEQGVAHLVEHVAFLGSPKRELLQGTGTRSNAYTDFHHTVFHCNSPAQSSGKDVLSMVLDALTEVAFEAKMAAERIEKERLAVLAEAQMMNSMQYRLDCKLLQYLHWENYLGCRFPIGKVEQVKTWKHEIVRSFWERHYYPANATLYLVGDFERDDEALVQNIQKTFGRIAPRQGTLPRLPGRPVTPQHIARLQAAAQNGGSAVTDGWALQRKLFNADVHTMDLEFVRKMEQRDAERLRPPVDHQYGYGKLDGWRQKYEGHSGCEVSLFQHPLMHNFQMQMYAKLPLRVVDTFGELRAQLLLRMVMQAFQFRMNVRTGGENLPFMMIDFDVSDSSREGCQVSTLSVNCGAKDWELGLRVAKEEVARLVEHGLTEAEFACFMESTMKDCNLQAKQRDSVSSSRIVQMLMDMAMLRQPYLDPQEYAQVAQEVVQTITREELRTCARSALSFVTYYGRESEGLNEASAQPGDWVELGPTRATSIIVAVPLYLTASGEAPANAGPMKTGELSTSQHIEVGEGELDIDSIVDPLADDSMDFIIPPGNEKFDITDAKIAAKLAEPVPTGIMPALQLPTFPRLLLSSVDLDRLTQKAMPTFVPPVWKCTALEKGIDATSVRPDGHEATGIYLRRLSNGLRVTYKYTDNEVDTAYLRLSLLGGRAAEPDEDGPAGYGCLRTSMSCLSQSLSVGPFKREELLLYTLANLLTYTADSEEDYFFVDVRSPGTSLEAAFQLLHWTLAAPNLDAGVFTQVVDSFHQGAEQQIRTLESVTMLQLMKNMYGQEVRRGLDPELEQLDRLEFEKCRDALLHYWRPCNAELIVVGDVDFSVIEQLSLKYLGTVPGRPDDDTFEPPMGYNLRVRMDAPIKVKRQVTWLQDSDNRGAAYIGGPLMPRWGPPLRIMDNCFDSLKYAEYPKTKVELPPTIADLAKGWRAAQQQSQVAAFKLNLEAAKRVRAAHPLTRQVAMQMLCEIFNSRLFYQVRDVQNLTYDVAMDLNVFDVVPTCAFFIHMTAAPDRIQKCLEAAQEVVAEFKTQPFTMGEVDRARSTILARVEQDCKENLYQVVQLQNLQREEVPYKTIETERDVVHIVNSVLPEDVQEIYDCLGLGEPSNTFTVMGVAAPQEPDWVAGYRAQFEHDDTKPIVLVAIKLSWVFNQVSKALASVAKQSLTGGK